MPDLSEQIHEFIDSGARPVTAREAIEAAPRTRPSRQATYILGSKPRLAGTFAIVATVIALILVLVIGLRSSPRGVNRINPAHSHQSTGPSHSKDTSRPAHSTTPPTTPKGRVGPPTPETLPGSDLLALQMFNVNDGVGVGEGPSSQGEFSGGYYLTATTDGGATWKVEGELPQILAVVPEILDMQFKNPEEGYIASGRVAFTGDGGRTWSMLPDTGQENGISLSGDQLWVVSGTCEVVNNSSQKCSTGLSQYLFGEVSPFGRTQLPIDEGFGQDATFARTSPTSGALISQGQSSNEVITTSDSGATWQTLPTPCSSGSPPPSSLVAGSPTKWFLLCQEDEGMEQGVVRLYETLDSGRDWRLEGAGNEAPNPRPVGNITDGMSAYMTTTDNGRFLWLLSQFGGVSISTDGGRNWRYTAFGDVSPVSAIAVESSTNAWVPVPGEGLFHTTNGTTWDQLP